MKHPIQREWVRRIYESHRIDFAFCKRVFFESWSTSFLKETRFAEFYKLVNPHVRRCLPFFLLPANRFVTVLLWEMFDLNFGSAEKIRRAISGKEE